jgi:hypothetical protein
VEVGGDEGAEAEEREGGRRGRERNGGGGVGSREEG